MTATVLHGIPVTGVMDLLFTTNGCIDILGGVDIQFMLAVRAKDDTVESPISMEAAKEIFMANCVEDQDRQGFVWSVEDQWYETYANAVESARRLREENQGDQTWRATYNL